MGEFHLGARGRRCPSLLLVWIVPRARVGAVALALDRAGGARGRRFLAWILPGAVLCICSLGNGPCRIPFRGS